MEHLNEENKKQAESIMASAADRATDMAENRPLVQVAVDNLIQLEAETRGEYGDDEKKCHKLSNSLQIGVTKTMVKEEDNGLPQKKTQSIDNGDNHLHVEGARHVNVKVVNTRKSQRYMRRASKDENVPAKEVESIRKATVEKEIKKEELNETEKEHDSLINNGLQSNDSLNGQQFATLAVKKARESLLVRFTVRQLREFICMSRDLPRPCQPSHSAPVRRQQRKEREMLCIIPAPAVQRQITANHDFKLTFPFLTMRVGDYQSSLPFGMTVHPQQQGRVNSLTINVQSKRLIYEFTLLDKNNNVGYAVWTLALCNIVAICHFDDLVYMKLNGSPMQVVSFTGNKSTLNYDITNGQVHSPFQYFQLIGPAQHFFDGLVRCDASHFAAILLSADEFLNEQGSVEARNDSHSISHENYLYGKNPDEVLMNNNNGDPLNFDEMSSGSIMAAESPRFKELLHYSALGQSKSFESQNSNMNQ